MIIRFLPLTGPFSAKSYARGTGPFPKGVAPGGKTFTLQFEAPPGDLESYDVTTLNISFKLATLPAIMLNIDLAYKQLSVAITSLEERKGLLLIAAAEAANAVPLAITAKKAAEEAAKYANEINNAGETKATQLQQWNAFLSEEMARAAVNGAVMGQRTAEAAVKDCQHEIENLTKEREILGKKEAQEMWHNFDPVTCVAELRRAVTKETVWIGNLTLHKVPIGASVSEIITGGEQKYRKFQYEEALLVHQAQFPIPEGINLDSHESLELVISFYGPQVWKLGAEQSGGVIFDPEEHKVQNFDIIGGRGLENVTNEVSVLSCEISVALDKSP
jgi:hypothetical protein